MRFQEFIRSDNSVESEIYVEPSNEAKFLLKHLSWLVSPKDGQGSILSRGIRSAMVAPFTQLTFFSFDLQAFLFQIFHQTKFARFGHFTFMIFVNFFLMVGLSSFVLADIEIGGTLLTLNAGTIFAAVLFFWYIAMAVVTRLHAWMIISLPVVVGLYALSQMYVATFFINGSWYAPTEQLFNPWMLTGLSAFLIAFSHSPEPKLPPRAAKSMEWASVPEFVFGTSESRHGPLTIVIHGLRTLSFLVWGTLDELWASPRLMPYNFLMIMFEQGYAPERFAELKERADSAIASGNPAIDFVGVGGGAFMQLPESA